MLLPMRRSPTLLEVMNAAPPPSLRKGHFRPPDQLIGRPVARHCYAEWRTAFDRKIPASMPPRSAKHFTLLNTRPPQYYEPIRLPTAPGLAFTGLRLISRSTTRWGLPCCPSSRCVRAVVTTPVELLGACRSLPQQCQLSL